MILIVIHGYRKDLSLQEAFEGADVFIGLSKGNVVTKEMVAKMAPRPIVFAMAYSLLGELSRPTATFVVNLQFELKTYNPKEISVNRG